MKSLASRSVRLSLKSVKKSEKMMPSRQLKKLSKQPRPKLKEKKKKRKSGQLKKSLTHQSLLKTAKIGCSRKEKTARIHIHINSVEHIE